jgi:hypothetical protein
LVEVAVAVRVDMLAQHSQEPQEEEVVVLDNNSLQVEPI